jgi:hypothetical protein
MSTSCIEALDFQRRAFRAFRCSHAPRLHFQEGHIIHSMSKTTERLHRVTPASGVVRATGSLGKGKRSSTLLHYLSLPLRCKLVSPTGTKTLCSHCRPVVTFSHGPRPQQGDPTTCDKTLPPTKPREVVGLQRGSPRVPQRANSPVSVSKRTVSGASRLAVNALRDRGSGLAGCLRSRPTLRHRM